MSIIFLFVASDLGFAPLRFSPEATGPRTDWMLPKAPTEAAEALGSWAAASLHSHEPCTEKHGPEKLIRVCFFAATTYKGCSINLGKANPARRGRLPPAVRLALISGVPEKLAECRHDRRYKTVLFKFRLLVLVSELSLSLPLCLCGAKLYC